MAYKKKSKKRGHYQRHKIITKRTAERLMREGYSAEEIEEYNMIFNEKMQIARKQIREGKSYREARQRWTYERNTAKIIERFKKYVSGQRIASVFFNFGVSAQDIVDAIKRSLPNDKTIQEELSEDYILNDVNWKGKKEDKSIAYGEAKLILPNGRVVVFDFDYMAGLTWRIE